MIYGAICFECFNRVDVVGDNFVEKALVKHTKTDEVIEIPLKAIFGYIGTEPKTDLFKPCKNWGGRKYSLNLKD